ncbi:helix-turn-helix transcriptional regulator [Streptomyces sp. NPDC003247]|uniref:helix-turn-helix transcriptional regulator n=1 Tax=Streptomyces sp. NPDC003247 TaxID=3364677 RepID=UPI0036A302AE
MPRTEVPRTEVPRTEVPRTEVPRTVRLPGGRTAARRPPVGREEETDRLRRILADRSPAGPRLVRLTGDPGTGKTRLLTEWGERAERAGFTLLAGRASPRDRDRPFALFAEPVARLLADPVPTAAVAPADRTLLHRCLLEPDLAAGRSRRETAAGGPDRLLHVIGDLVWAAARHRPVLLSLDDLHWADDRSLDLLSDLLRRPRAGTRLVLVGALRPRQASAPLMAALTDTHTACRVDQVALRPLSRDAVDTLLGPATPPERRRILHRASGGNPLYLRILSLSPKAPRGVDHPHDLVLSEEAAVSAMTAVARELAPLGTVETDVLRAAAVLGDEFEPAHLAVVAGCDPPVAAAALDRLVALDLLRDDHPRGRLCRARHPVLRAAVHRSIPPAWRRDAHARADRLLRDTGAGPLERAPHVARSGRMGDMDAIRLLGEAADGLMDTDPALSASWLRTALSLLVEDREGLRASLTASLARALGLSGRLRACRELLRRTPPEPHRPTRESARRVAFHAMVERHLGDYRAAEALLEAELARVPEGADAVAHPMRLELATVRLLCRAGPRSPERVAELVDDVLRRTPDGQEPQRMAALVRLAHAGACQGDVTALRRSAAEACALADATGDTVLAAHLDTVCQLGWAEALAERHLDALRHTTRGVRLARETGQLFVLPHLQLAHSYAGLAAGRPADALRSAEEAEETARLLDRPSVLGFALALNAWATSLLDGPDAAAPLAERAVQEAGADGRPWGVTAGVLAGIRVAQGRPDEALDLARSAAEHSGPPGTARCVRPMWYALAAEAAAARDHGDGRVWARRARLDAEVLGLPGQRGHAALAEAHTSADPIGPLRSAIGDFRTAGLVVMECRAGLLLSRTLAARGRDEEALAAARHAKRLAESCGARHLRQQAVDVQRRLGARQPRTAREPHGTGPPMSVREREIARLVALGLSNGDIARALVVSPKTVEAHLTRVFRKTGVRSRAALIAVMTSEDTRRGA